MTQTRGMDELDMQAEREADAMRRKAEICPNNRFKHMTKTQASVLDSKKLTERFWHLLNN